MKPFNLTKALAGEPVMTRDGRKVAAIYHFKTRKSDYPVYACIDGHMHEYTTEGRYYDMGGEHKFDLVMEEPIIEGWINVYKENSTGRLWVGEVCWPTYEEAIHSRGDDAHYIKTIKIDNKPE